ncbi:MAG: NAD(P)-dependent oxidoreductase [Bacteroidetes bacterium]|nr:NAD(P)-dependent oxidoreductase [Bacteroidota bacterium]
MLKIGIVGASSQTGSSVAFFLQKFPDVEVTCFIRSSYSRIFFDLLKITCDSLDLNNADEAKQKLGQLDVVLDFSYPAGQLHEILSRSKDSIARTIAAMKKDSSYFYMSSIMAYGMPENDKNLKHWSIPRTSYAYIKRTIEGHTVAQGSKHGVKIYNFRLGQVHGFLQSVNGSFRKKLSDAPIARVDGNKEDSVNIIFIYTLCEAIVQCARGQHKPGLYTLVSSPQWTLEQLYGYYIDYYKLPATMEYVPGNQQKAKVSLVQWGLRLARPYRSVLETYLLMRMPGMAVKLKGSFRQSQLQQGGSEEREYIDYNLLGAPSVQTIPGLTTDPARIKQIEKEFEEYYNSTLFSHYTS